MAEPVSVTLPRGLFDPAGGQHREAVLRPVTGHFEMRLAELRSAGPEAVDGLLAASLDRVGGYTEITSAHAAALSRGDRDFLLLQLRRGVFGDRLDLVVVCPNPACREAADLELRVSDLAPEPAAAARRGKPIECSASVCSVSGRRRCSRLSVRSCSSHA